MAFTCRQVPVQQAHSFSSTQTSWASAQSLWAAFSYLTALHSLQVTWLSLLIQTSVYLFEDWTQSTECPCAGSSSVVGVMLQQQ